MIPYRSYRPSLRNLSIVALLGLSSGVQAVCLNADNSLDDGSMYTVHGEQSLLPPCKPEIDGKDAQSEHYKAQTGPAKAGSELKKSVSDKKPPARANPS